MFLVCRLYFIVGLMFLKIVVGKEACYVYPTFPNYICILHVVYFVHLC